MRLICWMKGFLKWRPASFFCGSALIGLPTGLPNSVMKTCSVSLTVKALLAMMTKAANRPKSRKRRFMAVQRAGLAGVRP